MYMYVWDTWDTNVKKSNCRFLVSSLKIAVAVNVLMQKFGIKPSSGMVSLKRNLPKHLSFENLRQYSLIFHHFISFDIILLLLFYF